LLVHYYYEKINPAKLTDLPPQGENPSNQLWLFSFSFSFSCSLYIVFLLLYYTMFHWWNIIRNLYMMIRPILKIILTDVRVYYSDMNTFEKVLL